MKQTLENLTKAFIGESQARNRYTFYASIAKKEGFLQVGKIFEETADQEKEHAKRLFKLIQTLKGDAGAIEVQAEAPLVLGSTVENLKAAIEGEHYENVTMYPEFADVAEKEDLSEIAAILRSIGTAEVHHEERYSKLLKKIETNSVFKKEKKVYWVCSNCGYVHEGEEPPEKCPACNHPKKYFEVKCEEY